MRRALLVLALSQLACGESLSQADVASTENDIQAVTPSPSCKSGWGERPDSFAGVEGSYERAGPAPPGEMQMLALSNLEDAHPHAVSRADAARTFECGEASCPIELSRASLLPTMTATTPIILFSANGFARIDPDLRGLYDVLGIDRDPSGSITALCLYRVDLDAGTRTEPFLMRRKILR